MNSAASCGIENFEFTVSERVQVNPDNSRTMSALLSIVVIQIEYTANKNRQNVSQSKTKSSSFRLIDHTLAKEK